MHETFGFIRRYFRKRIEHLGESRFWQFIPWLCCLRQHICKKRPLPLKSFKEAVFHHLEGGGGGGGGVQYCCSKPLSGCVKKYNCTKHAKYWYCNQNVKKL